MTRKFSRNTRQNQFANVPIDSDTTVISQSQITVQGINALHQHWHWDGVRAESLIFVTEDVVDLTPDTLKDMLRREGLLQLNQSMTTSATANGYTFVNFNFRT